MTSLLIKSWLTEEIEALDAFPSFMMKAGQDNAVALKEVLPRKGLLYQEDSAHLALCRPKLMPLKSVTLEKLEQMQKAAQEKVRQQQEQLPNQQGMSTPGKGTSSRAF
ncbi:BBSome-interacting protein 1 [Halocaridina rubra]|uniref:BBSome-interacting protein 1 n=1 Tax=Halocaridina rubra TaxID=373956 RepID=A0AAN8X2R8_HALRR